ncbi:unnamed protein product [Discula destructiva]
MPPQVVLVSLEAARKRATEGVLESQDSQLVAMNMHRLHGIGTRSSSPVDPLDFDDAAALLGHQRLLKHPRPPKVHQQLLGDGNAAAKSSVKTNSKVNKNKNTAKNPTVPIDVTGNKGAGQDQGLDSPAVPAANLNPPHSDDASNERVSPHCPTESINSALKSGGDDANSLQSIQRVVHVVRPNLQTYSRKRKARRKMDSSQSPTQSNEGRSYERYLLRSDDPISSDPIPRPMRSSPPASHHRDTGTTNHDDETGPIQIDFSALAQGDTQTSIPDSLATESVTQQLDASPGYAFANPETPAHSKNPFRGSKAAGLLGSSQMFRQTQYSSAVKATFSPTSSRPSPDNFQPNSISPNSSPLKRPALGPSPLQGSSSVPQIPFVFDTSPQQADDDGGPYNDEIARSNISKSFRLPYPAPIETYKPVPRWEDREQSPESGSDVDDEWGEDMSDEEERRRQQVLLKKAQAKRRLEAITFERPSDEAIVPSTNKVLSSAAQRYLGQCEGVSGGKSHISIETESTQDREIAVSDSQGGIAPSREDYLESAVDEGISSNDVVPNTDPSLPSAPIVAADDEVAAHIPETSPARLRSPDNVLTGSPLTEPVSRHAQQPTEVTGETVLARNDEDGPSIVVSSSPHAPAFGTRARIRGDKTISSAPPPSSSTSPLSNLTVTPALSNKTTPLTEESPRRLTPTSMLTSETGSSPAVAKAHRQTSKLGSKPVVRTNGGVMTRRTTRQSFPSNVSVSTDELARSPSTSTSNLALEKSTRLRVGRASMRESLALRTDSRGGAKIFTGMVFAISFQGKQTGEKEAGYKARMIVSTQIKNKVKQGGGRVLADGFDQLFEISPVKNAEREDAHVSSTPQIGDDITIALSARQTGFTALIADGHSRKVKYMQALALGLPCIHDRWITTCVEKQRLVDWSDYLLCAGNSAFLGEAIKSRNLQPYDAATAKLSEVIRYRPRLLDQSRILLLMSRAEESKKAAYVFLARVLGASLSRVYTVEEARRQLKAREEAGRPFDWLYAVDEKIHVADMFTSTRVQPASKKRKRKGEAVPVGPPAKRVRGLSDELVIQSLILGRLMEEEELVAATAAG